MKTFKHPSHIRNGDIVQCDIAHKYCIECNCGHNKPHPFVEYTEFSHSGCNNVDYKGERVCCLHWLDVGVVVDEEDRKDGELHRVVGRCIPA